MPPISLRILTLIIICLLCIPSWAQKRLNFRQKTIRDGLSQSTVRCIAQDGQGFMWFGTIDGLNRFDGYDFRVFKPNPRDPHAIGDMYISFIFMDQHDRMWVGTRNSGLERYDHKLERFTNFSSREGNRPRDIRFASYCPLPDGSILIGTRGGYLEHFDPETQRFTPKFHLLKDGQAQVIQELVYDREGRIWIGTGGAGVAMLAPDGKTRFFEAEDGLKGEIIWSMIEDSQGTIWVGTDVELARYEPEKDRFFTYTSEGKHHGLPEGRVESLMEDREGRFWIGTRSGTIALFNREEEYFIQYRARDRSASFSTESIASFFEDRTGTIWAGTYGQGVHFFDPASLVFHHYRNNPNNPHGLNSRSVWEIMESRDGALWVGTQNGGLNMRDPETEMFQHYLHDPKDPSSISHNVVRAVVEDPSGDIWAGTLAGLDRLDRKTGRFTHYYYDPTDPRSLSNDMIQCLYVDEQGRLWVGTFVGGANMLEPGTDHFIRYRHDSNDPDSLISKRALAFATGPGGRIWIGTTNGISVLDQATGKFQHFQNDPEQPDSLSHNAAATFLNDSKGRMWVGTTGGLNLLISGTDRFRHYRAQDGMPNEYIYGILEDDSGYIWCSTNKGLARLNPETNEIRAFYEDDGLQSDEFNAGSYCKGRDGKLYFGGINGFNMFDPDLLKANPHPPRVSLTELLLLNQPVSPGPSSVLSVAAPYLKEVTLGHKDYLFGFEFSALHYANPNQNSFAYRMEGLDDNWIHTDYTRRFATYTSLSPGVYTFRVKAANKDGVWNEEGLSVRVKILPPPWLSWWAYLLYALALVSLIYIYVKRQEQRLALQRDAAEQERAVSARLRQIDRHKDEFLANTSHELRTPLNGIIGLAESLIDGATGSLKGSTVKNLEMIVASGKRLANLVNDILDFTKIRENSLALNLKPVDMRVLSDMVLTLSRPLVGHKPVTLYNAIPEDLPLAQGDEDRLQQIMYNLVGNAIKFTDGGSVTVEGSRKGDLVIIAVRDTGIGIPAQDHERIFESFQQADGDVARIYGGTGLGLALCRRLVELHEGTIWLESEPGKGSCFSFSIPVCKQKGAVSGQFPAIIVDEPAIIEEEEVHPNATSTDGAGYRILIVDDEPVNRQVLKNHLVPRGYEVHEAEDGCQALHRIEEERFDLILLDVMMPRMSGYETCRKLRMRQSVHELPVLFLTARNQVADLKEGFRAGANDYLTKPVSKDELLSRLKTHLSLLETHRELEARVAERTRELQRRNEELDERNREILQTRDQLILNEKMASLGTLASGIAHEIRNPLTFINGFAEVSADMSQELRNELAELQEALEQECWSRMDSTVGHLNENTQKICEHGRRANQIVQSMIILARGEGGERKSVCLNSLVNEFVTLSWQGRTAYCAEDICVELSEAYDPGVGNHQVVAQNLGRALVSLIQNSLEAIAQRANNEEEGYAGEVKVWTRRSEHHVKIGFVDNGQGIAKDTLNHAFTPFYTNKEGNKNVGLGLSLVHEIVVREHGGNIELTSEPGQGTRVVISLPIDPGDIRSSASPA